MTLFYRLLPGRAAEVPNTISSSTILYFFLTSCFGTTTDLVRLTLTPVIGKAQRELSRVNSTGRVDPGTIRFVPNKALQVNCRSLKMANKPFILN